MENREQNYDSNHKGLSRTIIKFIIVFCFLFFCYHSIFICKDYKRFYREREEQRVGLLKYIERNCKDDKIMNEMGVSDECHDKLHTLEDTPQDHAIYDVLDAYSLCGKQGCLTAFKNQNPFVAITQMLIVFVMLFFLALAIGTYIFFKRTPIGASLLPLSINKTKDE